MNRCAVLLVILPLLLSAAPPSTVQVWEENLVIPTYVSGPPDPNPFFYTGRAYQGARGEVYPYPMYDNLTDKLEKKTYHAIYLENEYLKICVLPELGGRIFSAVDKTNGYNFFYKQSVIKPALIGMLGAWISGGVEWNVPHHHRPSSFMDVEYYAVDNPDGSKTLWVGEMELRQRMRWAVGLTLRPGSSVLEATVRVLNTTPLAHSMLYFANVAVHTNENYQVIFPPSTQFATQHAKREFSRWPIADSVYGGVDFSKGVDVSWWKNHPSPLSMFAWNDQDDFLAGYDHGKQAGTLHVADHNSVPGKKFFTWGNGPQGRMWDNILSDTDGPYLELMVGAYSDNQPDYSWLEPYETKDVRQFWYPYRTIGAVKNATVAAAVNLEVTGRTAKVGFHVTAPHAVVTAKLTASGRPLWSENATMDPGKPLVREVPLPEGVTLTDLRVTLLEGVRELVSYQPQQLVKQPTPSPVDPPGDPKNFKTTEELYLAGQRLEQFHNPALDPDPYYEEALRRDPSDSRANTALAQLYLKRGRYADAEKLLRAATARLTHNYTRPRDGEAQYYLGLALKAQRKYAEAEDALQRAAWNIGWSAAAYYQLAEVASLHGDFEHALELVDRSLAFNAWNTRAFSLKSFLELYRGRPEDSAKARERIAALDPLDPRGSKTSDEALARMKPFPDETLEMAVQCMDAGLYRAAAMSLEPIAQTDPIARYYQGLIAERSGHPDQALAHYLAAAQMKPDYVFPFQLEAAPALEAAMKANPKDARAPYYLGDLFYDRQPQRATELWEKSRDLDPNFAVVWRNLAVAYSRLEGGTQKAIAALEKAIQINPNDGLYFFELDKLYETARVSVAQRLKMLESHPDAVARRDDTVSREVLLLMLAGQNDKAVEIMSTRHFHLWEGGVRFNVQDAWTDIHLALGHKRMAARDYKGALVEYKTAMEFPKNIEAARSYRGSRLPETLYFEGTAYDALGDKENARAAWRQSAAQLLGSDEEPMPSVDNGAALLYYQGLSLKKLGETQKANAVFASLLSAGQSALAAKPENDFFAKFGEGQSRQDHLAQAHYVAGLGYLGGGDPAKARPEFANAVQLNPYHPDAQTKLRSLEN